MVCTAEIDFVSGFNGSRIVVFEVGILQFFHVFARRSRVKGPAVIRVTRILSPVFCRVLYKTNPGGRQRPSNFWSHASTVAQQRQLGGLL